MQRLLMLCVMLATSYLFVGLAQANDLQRCQIQLEQSQTHALIVDQDRDGLEKRLAEALRANRELSQMVDQRSADARTLADEVAKLKAEKTSDPLDKKPDKGATP